MLIIDYKLIKRNRLSTQGFFSRTISFPSPQYLLPLMVPNLILHFKLLCPFLLQKLGWIGHKQKPSDIFVTLLLNQTNLQPHKDIPEREKEFDIYGSVSSFRNNYNYGNTAIS